MTVRFTLINIAIFALLSQPMSLFGQTTGDWSAIKALSVGQEIRVETKAGKKVDGKLVSVSDARISVSHGGQAEEFSVADVKKVYRIGKVSRGTGIAMGAAIGAGVGAAIGGGALAATGGSDNTGGVIAPFIAVGAGIGALVGGLIPRKKRTLVYEAK